MSFFVLTPPQKISTSGESPSAESMLTHPASKLPWALATRGKTSISGSVMKDFQLSGVLRVMVRERSILRGVEKIVWSRNPYAKGSKQVHP